MSGDSAEQSGQPAALKAFTDVFISYASQDKAVADAVCEALERAGVACWIAPRNVTPGEFYAESIVHAIDSTKVIVLVLSRQSADSQHVLREVERASSRRHPVVSFRIDTAPLPAGLEYFLNSSQWLDASATGVDRALPRLVDAVKSALAQPTTAARVDPGSPATTGANHRRRLMLVASGAIILAALAYLVTDKLLLSKHITAQQPVASIAPMYKPPEVAIADKSVAVLPFVDMSEKKDQEYFADGMAEEIIDMLTKVPSLHVPARTSSFFFKGKATKIPDIARELNVANVIEGSIRRSGNQIRVTAQLVRADTGYHVWSETYDRNVHDIFKVQDDIANSIVQALQISLMGGSLTRQKGGTQNLEAYQLLLRARQLESLGTKESFLSARQQAEQAIKLDPTYALAQTELGFLMTELATSRALPATDGFERARQLAQHALQLSPDLYDAHNLLSYIHRTYDFDWAGAQAEARQALALEPNNVYVLLTAGQISSTVGNWADAERQLRAAVIRDPLNAVVQQNLAKTLYRAGRFADAESAYRKLIELSPTYPLAHAYLGKTLLAEGKLEAALAMAQLEPEEADRMDLLPVFLLANGRHADADAALKVLVSKYANTDAHFIALNYAYRNERDSALQWLERAYQQKDSGFVEMAGEHLFRNLTNDPRYKAFLRKMNLPE